MNKQEKEVVINDIKQLMGESQAMFLINYKGMTVPVLQGLRKSLRGEGGRVRVAKATLMQIAARDIKGAESFAEQFKDQVGLVFVQKDVSGVAKHLVAYAKDNEKLKVLAGFYESKVLSAKDMDFLASLPSREVLLAQLLGTMQAPVTNLTRVLYLLIARLAIVLKRIEEKQAQG